MKKKRSTSEWEIVKSGKKLKKVKIENFHHKMKKKTMFGQNKQKLDLKRRRR